MNTQTHGIECASLIKGKGTACGGGIHHPTATRIISLILSLAMLLSITAGFDFSTYAVTNGDYEYTILDDGTIAIKGYNGNATSLTIPSVIDGHNVSVVDFYSCENANIENVKNVVVSNGIKSINYMCFRSFKSLEKILIFENIIDISETAFINCNSLKDIYFSGTEERWNQIINDCLYGKIEIDYTTNLWHYIPLESQMHYNCLSLPKYSFDDLTGYKFDSYIDYVNYTSVYNNFINGTNPPYYTEFSPKVTITRAMFVTILYRMAGEPYKNTNPYNSSPFTDITNTSVYYYDAACWALDNNITTQITFKPYDNVSREQTASFLFRYANENGYITDDAYKKVNLSDYHDYDNIRDWAEEAMQWANYNGMITGTQQGYANPQGSTLRIHATKILYGFGKTCNIGNFE